MSEEKKSSAALYQRVHRWRGNDGLKQIGETWVLKRMGKGVREALSDGERMEAVLKAAKLNKWIN